MTTKDVLALALEALEVCEQSDYGRKWVWPDTAHPSAMENVREAITAIKQAQEPVGINGLTEAETSASMSVMGLSKPATKQAQEPETWIDDGGWEFPIEPTPKQAEPEAK